MSAAEVGVEVYAESERAYHGERPDVIPTELPELDALLPGGGMELKRFNVVASRTGHGKTTFLLHAARVAAQAGRTVDFFSMEMPKSEIVRRLISADTDIPSEAIKLGKMSDEQWKRYTNVLASPWLARIMIDDSGRPSVEEVESKVRSFGACDLVVVDYIQLMAAPGFKPDNKVGMITHITAGLKDIAMALNTRVLAAAQVNRQTEARQNKRPQLADLRDSGSLEQDADAVLFLYRDVLYNPATEQPHLAEINVAKNRDGEMGMARARFNGACKLLSPWETISLNERPF